MPDDPRGHDRRGCSRSAEGRDGAVDSQGHERTSRALGGPDWTGRECRSGRRGRSALLMKIGNIALAPPFALAPMAGMTDTAFRRLVKRKGGCGLVVTEMVSSEGLVRGIDRTP